MREALWGDVDGVRGVSGKLAPFVYLAPHCTVCVLGAHIVTAHFTNTPRTMPVQSKYHLGSHKIVIFRAYALTSQHLPGTKWESFPLMPGESIVSARDLVNQLRTTWDLAAATHCYEPARDFAFWGRRRIVCCVAFWDLGSAVYFGEGLGHVGSHM